MKIAIAFLALSLCAAAQTLTGLPQYGVELTGTVDAPVITNHSGKDIYELSVVFYDAAGHVNGTSTENYFANSFDDVLHNGQSDEIHGATPKPTDTVHIIEGTLPGRPPRPMTVKIVLDSVVFGDGSFVGPDVAKLFAQTVMEFAISSATASLTKGELTSLAKTHIGSYEDHIRYRVAMLLTGDHSDKGAGATQKITNDLINLPKVRRVQ